MALRRPAFLLTLALLMSGCGGDDAQGGRPPEAPRPGADIYKDQCTLCHGKDGRLGINGAKDLTLSSLTRDEMIQVVTNGKGLMMPYQRVLDPKEIEAVVHHVRSLKVSS